MLKGIAVSEGIAQGTAVCVDTGSSTGNSDGTYRKAESREAEAGRFSEAMGSFIEETERAVGRALDGEDISDGALYFAARDYADSERMRWFDEKLTLLFRHGGHEFFKE